MASSLAAAAMVDNMEGVEHIPAAPRRNLYNVLGKASAPVTVKPHSDSTIAPTQPSTMAGLVDMDVDDPDDLDDPFAEEPLIVPAPSPVPPKAVNFALASPSNMTPSPAPHKLSDILTAAATVPPAMLITVTPKPALKPMHKIFIRAIFPVKDNKDHVKATFSQIAEYFKLIHMVDPSAALLKWGKEMDLDSDACLEPSALPLTLTGLQAYASDLCPTTDGGNTWCNLCIHF